MSRLLVEEMALIDSITRSLEDLDRLDGPLAGRCHGLRSEAAQVLIEAISEAARRSPAVAEAIAEGAPLKFDSGRAAEIDLGAAIDPLLTEPRATEKPTSEIAGQSLQEVLSDLYLWELLEVSNIAGATLAEAPEVSQ